MPIHKLTNHTAYTHLPDEVFSNPRPLAALNQLLAERPLAVLQIVLFITGIELTAGKQDPEKAPGQLGRFGEAFKPEGEDEMAAVQLKELKNGRLAMVAIIGQWVQVRRVGLGWVLLRCCVACGPITLSLCPFPIVIVVSCVSPSVAPHRRLLLPRPQELLTGQGPIEQLQAGHISPFGDGQGFF